HPRAQRRAVMRKFVISLAAAGAALAVAAPAAAQYYPQPQPYGYGAPYGDAYDLKRRLHRDVRDGRGLSFDEMRQIEYRIARLEQRIYREANDGNRWSNGYTNYSNGYYDRDRDGRDDRYEDDRGR